MANELGITLPPVGDYAVGCVFLPRERSERAHCERRLEKLTAEEGQKFLGWRNVPIDSGVIGRTARTVEPVIRQAFVARYQTSPSRYRASHAAQAAG